MKYQIPIVQGQIFDITLHSNSILVINEEFFETFNKNISYIRLCTTEKFLKNIVIDPLRRSFIEYTEDTDPSYKWKIVYLESSSSCECAVLINKQTPNLCKNIIYPDFFHLMTV
ncbi:MAG TPA: hypothetical protein LFW14_02825 [Rickettsia endosymbiont of Degeeriella rufa]|nr:hypothetical protein [Rickettsia endosymbiont of Degeeriella rufa]